MGLAEEMAQGAAVRDMRRILGVLALLFMGGIGVGCCARRRVPVGEPMVQIAKKDLEAKDLEIFLLNEQVAGLQKDKEACEQALQHKKAKKR